jgi:hypothetical protein
MNLTIRTFHLTARLVPFQSKAYFRLVSFNSALSGSLRSPDGSVGSFHSATSTLSASSMATAEEGDTIYMEGSQPTRTDFQVFKAIEAIDIPYEKYPNLYEWLGFMRNVSEKEMSGWKPFTKKQLHREKGRKLNFYD